MSDECLFCGVVSGSQPAQVVLDEPDVLAFLDIRPLFFGHVLVVPKAHVVTLMELNGRLVDPLFQATRRLSIATQKAMDSDGIFVANNNGVSQSVAHLHIHVVPRRKKDGLRGFMWPRHKYESQDQVAEIGGRISAALEHVE